MKEERLEFQKLTPFNNVDLSIYEDALGFVFENVDIKNVAISGAYCAGKSSVIETYKKKHSPRFLHISLAHFKSQDTESQNHDIKESILEAKILNQLLHQIEPDKIPQTNFKVKKKIIVRNIIRNTLLIIGFFLSLFHVALFEVWEKFYNTFNNFGIKLIFKWSVSSESRLLTGLICSLLFGLLIFTLLKAQRNRNIFKKINLQGNEIEIYEESSESYFDKYLNEVLYLFENADADVIVFEDIDRFNSAEIFERLREINRLINLQFAKDKKSPLRFFYLLRDDIFVSKDRLKFFDYIIPIVPVVDSSNSFDQFITHLKQGNIYDRFDMGFLKGISLYIDDMRLLKNIYNEFLVYYNRLNNIELDYNKMLSIIVYKNLFPRDFSDLQLNQGFIFAIFNEKNKYIEREKESINEKIVAIRSQLESIKKEHLNSVYEVDLIYNKKRDELNLIGDVQERRRLAKLYNDESETRKTNLEIINNNKIPLFENDLVKLELDLLHIEKKLLKEIINKDNIDVIFQKGNNKNYIEINISEYFDLLKYLIRNGYIDETYQDYMTYFYGNSISLNDKMFLRSVADQKPKGYTYPLKNLSLILEHLRLVDFNHEETLNFELFEFLLINQKKYSEQLVHLINQLKTQNNVKFIYEFFSISTVTDKLVHYLNHNWPEFFTKNINDVILSEDQKIKYSLASIYYSSNEDLHAININGIFSGFIENRSNYLKVDKPNVKRIIEVFKLLNIKFTFIVYEISDKALWTEVYSNNLYKINSDMIDSILLNQYKIPNVENYKYNKLTLIISRPKEPISSYVKENIDSYLEHMLQGNNRFCDNEDAISLILNSEKVSDEMKYIYIDRLQTRIKSLSIIDDKKLWTRIIEHKLLIYSNENVLLHFFNNNNTIDVILVNFINQNNAKMDFGYDAINNAYGENTASIFYKAVLQCNNLKNERYKAILYSLNRYYETFIIQGVDSDKINILIDLRIIRMNSDTLLFMRENYPNNTLYFIEKNIQEYAEQVLSVENIIMEEATSVLSINVQDNYKIQIIKLIKNPISIKDKKYSDAIEIYILENNFDINDLQYILNRYDSSSELMRKVIERIAMIDRVKLFSGSYRIPFSFFESIIMANKDQLSDNLMLFSLVLPEINEDQCLKSLEKMELKDFISMFDGKRPKITANDINGHILSIFKQKGWITKYSIDNDEPDYYRVIGRKSYRKRT